MEHYHRLTDDGDVSPPPSGVNNQGLEHDSVDLHCTVLCSELIQIRLKASSEHILAYYCCPCVMDCVRSEPVGRFRGNWPRALKAGEWGFRVIIKSFRYLLKQTAALYCIIVF
jgi:hypothetical protein